MPFQPKFHTLVHIFQHAVREHAERPLFGVKRGGSWRWMSYAEFGRRVDRARGALDAAGVGAGDRVALIADNRPEWAIVAHAAYGLRAAAVPMYEAQHDAEWRYILRDSGAKMVFVANESIRDRIAAQRDHLPDLRRVVVFDGRGDEASTAFDAFLAEGDKRPVDIVIPEGEDIAGFVYTSGTTGNPKGVMLSHRNIAFNVSALHDVFPMTPEDRSLSFLPWAHVFGQTVELHTLFSMGASMGIAESVAKITDDLVEVQPTLLFAVPRIFNRIYAGMRRQMDESRGLTRTLFTAALENAKRRHALAQSRRASGAVELKHMVFDRLVFDRVRARFGGKLRYAFSGGAALSREVAEFIDDLGILVYEGYGLTETSPIVACNFPGNRKIGSVGKPIPGVRVEIDTAVTDDPKHGEIVVFGHCVMQGYYGLEEETAAVFVERDGERGLRTGDMGYLDGDGFLHISGRIKEQYKLLNGKYVVPTPLEESLKLSPFVSSAMVWGADHDHNVAVIVPDFDALGRWAAERGLAGDPATLVEDQRVRALFEDEIEKHSTTFKQYEKVRGFVLGATDFTTDNGLLTPSLKVKRRKVLELYGKRLEALYAPDGRPARGG
jgi:long-chain acyl-CoA synthetase